MYRVQPGDIVVDIGGNIGAFATYAAAVRQGIAGPRIRAVPGELSAMLSRNVRPGGCSESTVAWHLASLEDLNSLSPCVRNRFRNVTSVPTKIVVSEAPDRMADSLAASDIAKAEQTE